MGRNENGARGPRLFNCRQLNMQAGSNSATNHLEFVEGKLNGLLFFLLEHNDLILCFYHFSLRESVADKSWGLAPNT